MNDLSFLIPRLWSAEEALAAVSLLRRLADAIWEVHGERMAAEIAAVPERWSLDELLGPESIDEDLPF